jgi:hypothetical protein
MESEDLKEILDSPDHLVMMEELEGPVQMVHQGLLAQWLKEKRFLVLLVLLD